MMALATREQLNWAVHACIDRCLASKSPIAVLAEFQHELRIWGWAGEDIRAVDLMAHRFLYEILAPDHETNVQAPDDRDLHLLSDQRAN